jgi:hypothetical protein
LVNTCSHSVIYWETFIRCPYQMIEKMNNTNWIKGVIIVNCRGITFSVWTPPGSISQICLTRTNTRMNEWSVVSIVMVIITQSDTTINSV